MPDTISQSIDSLHHSVAACTRLFNDLKILDHSGHVSARLPDNSGFLIQGIHASRAQLVPDDLFTLGFDGEIIAGPKGTRPVSEFHIHSEIYKVRPDVNAVLHAHPMVPILFTIAEGAQLKMVINHGYRWRTGVPTHPDTAHISSPELGAAMAETMGECNAVLLRAHGIVLASESIPELLIDGIQFDRNAKAQLEATRLGPVIGMSEEELDIFEERFDRNNHAVKLWKYYTERAFEQGVLPASWENAV
ncbi:MAG: class II aldolase/adducin family protein [Proteobacteria bacterium]|nr:class II aldolase/adducin family protein [Pseudomonadota bacterium]